MLNLEEQLISIIKEFKKGNVTVDDTLEELGFNSISIIQLVVKIEEKFQIEFSDEELDASNYDTVYSFLEYIEKKVN
ncbi:hypothetical protein A3842_07870 [Paenibacillus sp. P3E]|uniref:acyl carrier protein n=1 Tax=Paenibacillus sp. P3E TaxID=1349435 RepID=UPI00093FF6AF|nr:acyl carrier protein [Paenibacillus sp. P3E]OKP84767.1 hypothetical protein A3842_07870 [Paenibacillus sp. P3E]